MKGKIRLILQLIVVGIITRAITTMVPGTVFAEHAQMAEPGASRQAP
jgi:hypothetical protein